MAPKDRKRVDPNSNYGVDRAAKIAGRAAKSGGLYTRFVEIGRVVLIQFGESEKGRDGREGGAAGGLAARRTRAPRVRACWRAASAPGRRGAADAEPSSARCLPLTPQRRRGCLADNESEALAHARA